MPILFLEQARRRPGARGHHVGDPWYRLFPHVTRTPIEGLFHADLLFLIDLGVYV